MREMNNLLVGREIFLMASDPWDFGTENGCGPFYGIIVKSNMQNDPENDFVLVNLHRQITYNDKKSCYLLVVRHFVNIYLRNIADRQAVSCNAILLSLKEAAANDLLVFSQERKCAFIGSISLVA